MKIKLRHSLLVALFSPMVFCAQAPSLGAAADYVLFTSNGAMGNIGITHLTGNVGSNSGSSTGFGNVNGVMNNNNGATGQAATDLLTAYGLLNSAVATMFPAPLLGGGQTLNAAIYSIAGNSTLNQTLTLDGQNNANAVFIFKIQGTFSSGSNAVVNLINGAKACNVFWKIEGLASLAPGTIMKGNIIANNAAISIGSGVILEGRALSTTGAVTVDNIRAYTPSGCGSPVLTGPAAPTLGASKCFALFSGNGPVSNSGNSFANGDVGTNVGLTTGYNALNISGAIHPIPDGITSNCATDLLIAYNFMNALTSDIELLYPAQFGNSLVLTPHTYLLNGATTFIDTLFLDAQNVPSAIFAIKIKGALSTGTYAKVSLINGALANNVYWQVEGAINIDDYSEMVGTFIGNNGAIDLGTGTNLSGRAMTTNGALQTDAVMVTMASLCSNTTASAPSIFSQPSSFTVCQGATATFTVGANGTGLSYQWKNGAVLLVNGGNISGANSSILKISAAGAGDVSSNYHVIVSGSAAPSATSSSAALALKTCVPTGLNVFSLDTKAANIFPNPFKNVIIIQMTDLNKKEKSELFIFDVSGRNVSKISILEDETTLHLDLADGIYSYELRTADQVTQTGKIIRQ